MLDGTLFETNQRNLVMVFAHDCLRLTSYDQDMWAERLRYRYDEADADQALQNFSVLRRTNLRLLARTSGEDIKRVGVRAEHAEESVEHMIRLYIAVGSGSIAPGSA